MRLKQLGENQRLIKDGIIMFPESSEPYINGCKCSKCGKEHFPSRPLCTECFGEELEPMALCREGTIYSFTVVHLGVKGFKTPYVLAWVDLGQSRLAAQLLWDAERAAELQPGQKVRLSVDVLREAPDGTELVGYKFEPVFMEV